MAAPSLTLMPPTSTLVSSDGLKWTFRYAVLGITPVATPTDFLQIIGSGSRTVRIKRIKVSGVATAAGNMPIQIVRRSTLGTQGSAAVTAITAGKHDANDPAPTASVGYVQTANWTTPGTSAGVIAADRLFFSASGTGNYAPATVFDFCTRQDKALLARGTSDYLYINLNGAAVPSGGVIDVEIETEEDGS